MEKACLKCHDGYLLWNLFFYFAKHEDKSIKNNLEKYIAQTKLSSDNLSIAETTTCCAHIDWLLINFIIHMSLCTTKPQKDMHPATCASAQSNQCFRCPHEENVGPWLLFESTLKTCQTARMPRLNWVFVGCAGHFLFLSCNGSYMSDVRRKPVFVVCNQFNTQTGLLSYRD